MNELEKTAAALAVTNDQIEAFFEETLQYESAAIETPVYITFMAAASNVVDAIYSGRSTVKNTSHWFRLAFTAGYKAGLDAREHDNAKD